MEIINNLKQTKIETLKYFDLPENQLSKTYGEGKWSIKQLLQHLTDAETVLYDRVRRIISEPRGVLWAFNPDNWEHHLQYNHRSLTIAKMIYSSVRDGVIELAENHYKDQGHLEFIHSETGLRTLKDEMDKIYNHNNNHLKHIQIALSK